MTTITSKIKRKETHTSDDSMLQCANNMEIALNFFSHLPETKRIRQRETLTKQV